MFGALRVSGCPAGIRGVRRLKAGSALLAVSLVAVLLALLLAAPSTALAKDFHIADVTIASKVAANGDLAIEERRTFDFSGDFSWVQWELITKGSTGLDIAGVTGPLPDGTVGPYTLVQGQAFEPGTFSVADTGATVLVRVAFMASNEQFPLTLRYTARGAAKRYEDAADLYWQFIGGNTEVRTDRVHIAIEPPEPMPKADVRAWAHGPLNGVVAIGDTGTVTLDVTDVPPQTFVEARVLYPPEALSGAAVIGSKWKERVLAEEGRLADEANRERVLSRVKVTLALGGPGLLAVLGLAFGVWAFFAHGRDPRAQFSGQYFREDPEPSLHPAVVGSVWRLGPVTPADMSASLIDLADRGVIRLEQQRTMKSGLLGPKEESTWVIALVPEKMQGISQLDDQLIRLLFTDVAGGGERVTPDEIRAYAKAHPQAFTSSVDAWKTTAESQADSLGYLDPSGNSWRIGMFVLAGALVALGWITAVLIEWWVAGILPVLAGLCVAAMAPFMTRRTSKGVDLFSKYQALRRFLKDFSRLDEAPPASVILWERFLVLAVVFGVADEVIEQLRVKLPQVVEDPGFAVPYLWVYGGGAHAVSPAAVFTGGFQSAVSTATSQMSSSSGGGGGFSGGGGGGGGGGGVSAG